MRMTLTVPSAKMRHFQDLVKFYDLRFVGRPHMWNDIYHVTVTTDDMSKFNRFSETWDRITTPNAPPRQKRWWTKFFDWLATP